MGSNTSCSSYGQRPNGHGGGTKSTRKMGVISQLGHIFEQCEQVARYGNARYRMSDFSLLDEKARGTHREVPADHIDHVESQQFADEKALLQGPQHFGKWCFSSL